MTVGRGQQLLLAEGTPPAVAGLTIDGTPGSVTNSTGSATSGTISAFSTTKTNDLLVCIVSAVSSSGTVPAVSSIATSGLTWTKRTSNSVTLSGGTHSGAMISVEEWTAPASAIQTSISALITFASAPNEAFAAVLFAVNGCQSITSPFDPHSGLPTSAGDTSASSGVQCTANISTTDSPGMIICANSNMQSQFPAVGSGCTLIKQVSAVGVVGLGPILSIEYEATAAPQTSLAVAYGNSSAAIWNAVWDALH